MFVSRSAPHIDARVNLSRQDWSYASTSAIIPPRVKNAILAQRALREQDTAAKFASTRVPETFFNPSKGTPIQIRDHLGRSVSLIHAAHDEEKPGAKRLRELLERDRESYNHSAHSNDGVEGGQVLRHKAQEKGDSGPVAAFMRNWGFFDLFGPQTVQRVELEFDLASYMEVAHRMLTMSFNDHGQTVAGPFKSPVPKLRPKQLLDQAQLVQHVHAQIPTVGLPAHNAI